jgi:hypothetical protein
VESVIYFLLNLTTCGLNFAANFAPGAPGLHVTIARGLPCFPLEFTRNLLDFSHECIFFALRSQVFLLFVI